MVIPRVWCEPNSFDNPSADRRAAGRPCHWGAAYRLAELIGSSGRSSSGPVPVGFAVRHSAAKGV